MRPRHLEVEAIGPFGSLVEVDFDEVAVDGLFLIHGPTGAGKTSLLDAVCFALYGRVPGARGKAKSDRSHHAGRGVGPRAALVFDAQGGTYRVDRTPQWEAPKVRGDGTTPKAATAVLRRVDPGLEQVLATKPGEVDREIERLVGLTAAQFQQVILLPQGEFERFLRANSREREEVLETLFDTLDYKLAAEWLDQQAKVRRTEVGRLGQRLEVIGDEALRRTRDVLGSDPPPAPASRGDHGGGTTLLDRPRTVLDGDRRDPATLDDLVVALTETAEALASKVTAAEAAERAARRRHDQAAARNDQILRRRALAEDLAALDAVVPRVDAARERIVRAEEAERLRTSLDEVAHHQDVVDRAAGAVAADLASARRAVASLRVSVPSAAGLDLATVPPARAVEPVTQDLSSRRAVLDGLRDTARRARSADAEMAGLTVTVERRTAEADAARDRAAALEADRPATQAEVDAARAATERLTDLDAAVAAATTRADAARALARLAPRVADAREAHQRAREALADRRDAHDLARKRHLDGIAADLAGRLELGEACLVCGSLDHPDPARAVDGAVSVDELDALQAEVDAAEAAREDAASTLLRLETEQAEQRGIAGPDADDPVTAVVAAEALRADLANVRSLAQGLDRNLAALARLDTTAETARAAAAAAETEVIASRQRLAVLTERTETARAALAEHLPVDVELDDALGSLDRAIDALGRVGDHAAGNREAAAKLQAAQDRAARELAASPFETVDGARGALVDPAEQERVRERIADHDRRRTEVGAQLADPAFVDLPDVAPDLDALVADLAAAEADRNHQRDRLTLTGNARTAVAELAVEHRRVAEAHRIAEAEAELHETVADRCTGRAAPKVPLQRWVLGTYLEEVCTHANRRLTTMTSGRYQLRVTRTGARANSPAGLDLRVHDANTNQEREVSTLSGGETFQASLALALGVADSVEAHTGGVRLEALFIDEGFGTLDADALELAMDELDTLREGGRMVGVISHVAGLRERIHLGIEVRKGEAGSSVEVGAIS